MSISLYRVHGYMKIIQMNMKHGSSITIFNIFQPISLSCIIKKIMFEKHKKMISNIYNI